MSIRTELRAIAAKAIAPPPTEPNWKWMERHIYLGPKVSPAAPGKYSTKHTPAVRGIGEVAQDGEKRFISVQKCSQAGITTFFYGIILHRGVNDPLPVAISMQSVDACRKKSEKTLQPIIKASPVLREYLPDNPDHFKNLQQDMKTFQIDWMGSSKPGQISSETYGVLLIDEPDKYPIVLSGESTPLFLLQKRAATIWNHLILMPCTPTNEHGVIHKEFTKGDQRRYFIPCPKCGQFQHITWQNHIKFNSKLGVSDAAASAYIQCQYCKGRFSSMEKNAALEVGEWRPTAKPLTPDRASFHYPRWLTTWESGNVEAIVQEFMQVKDKPNELKGWIQNDLAEPFIEEKIELEDAELKDRRAPYKWQESPIETEWFRERYKLLSGAEDDEEQPDFDDITRAIVTVDVQKAHLWICARQWVKGGHSAGITFQIGYSWQDVCAVAMQYRALMVIVDSGYRTQEVYKACAQYGFVACQGRKKSASGQLWNQSTINVFEGTRAQSNSPTATLITYESDQIREQLAARMNGYFTDEKKRRRKCPFDWWIARNAPSDKGEYVDQVTAEYYDSERGEWVIHEGKQGNHAWDTEVMQLLGAEVKGFNRLELADTAQN